MDIEKIRTALREKYQKFVEAFGNLNKSRNRNLINLDAYGFKICASLEKKIDNNWLPDKERIAVAYFKCYKQAIKDQGYL